MITQEQINETYAELEQATGHYSAVELARINSKSAVDNMVAEALASGNVTGKNATERDANARALFEEDFHALSLAEMATHKAKLDLDIANIAVSRLKMLMRLEEATTR